MNSAGKESRGYCHYKNVNGIKRHLAVDNLGIPFFVNCTKASVSDNAGLIEMFSRNIEYFKKKPMNEKKITILLDNGYSIDKLSEGLKKIYPKIMSKIRLKLSPKPKSDKVKGFKPIRGRWIVERSNSWMGKCKSLVKNFDRTLEHSETKINLCFSRLMIKRLAKI